MRIKQKPQTIRVKQNPQTIAAKQQQVTINSSQKPQTITVNPQPKTIEVQQQPKKLSLIRVIANRVIETVTEFIEIPGTGGGTNYRFDARNGLSILQRLKLRLGESKAGHRVAVIVNLLLRSRAGQSLAASLTGTARSDSAAGIKQRLLVDVGNTATATGGEVAQMQIAGTVTSHVVTAEAYEVNGETNFSNPQNFQSSGTTSRETTALESRAQGGNGVVGLTPRAGGLRGTGVDISSTGVAIQSVEVRFYLRHTGATVIADGAVSYGVEGSMARTTLGSMTGNFDQEFTHDITALIGGDWSRLSNPQMWVECTTTAARDVFARHAFITVNVSETRAV